MTTPPNYRRAACCGACSHLDKVPDMDGGPPDYWCALHNVETTTTATCDDYAPDDIVTIKEFKLQ